MSTGTCEVCGGATDDGKVCRACLLGNVLDGDEGLLELPEELGGFRILERIGRGSSGEVWRAFQPGPDREVALKVFLDHRLGGSVDRTRFLREAQSLGKLDHPGIVPVYATGEEGGFLFIASRWMSGGTLEERVSEGGFVGREKETAEAMIQVVRAVAHAHQHGLVHRDIKPANILIDHKGAYCLADFGIAISEREAGECEASGTPAYMAPEIWAGEPVTTASDIWALGALMFEMLTGRLPRNSREALPGELDPRIRAIISQCLEDEPSARYAGASSLLKDLESFLSGRCVEALKEGLWMRLLRWSRRRPGLAIMSLIGLLLALTAGILGLNNWRITRENERRSVADAARFRQHAYVADVYLASRALADNQLGVARAMLDRHVPAEDERDLRGFEWHAYASLAEGDESQVFTDHDGEIRALAYDPSGRYLLSGSRDARVMVRDLKAGELVLSLPEADAPKEAGEIPLMAMLTAKSPEAKRFLLSGAGKVDELRMRARPSRLGEIMCAAWSHDGTKFVTGGGGSFLRIWSFPEGKLIGFLPQYPNHQLAFSADDRKLISLVGHAHKFELRIHDLDSLSRLRTIPDVEPAFALHGDRLAFVAKGEQRMKIVELGTGESLVEWRAEAVGKLEFSPDGSRLHGISASGLSHLLWDAASGRLLKRKESEDGTLQALVVGGGRSVIAGEGQVLRIEQADLTELGILRGHGDEILSLALSPDGRSVASAGKDRKTRIWPMPDGDGKRRSYHGHGAQVMDMASNGRLWLVQRERFAEIWAPEGLVCRTPGQALGLSVDGQLFATWRQDEREAVIEWWTVDTASLLDTLRIKLIEQEPWVFGWSDDGARCAVAVGNRFVRVFDPRSGEVHAEWKDLELTPLRLIFSPRRGQVLAYGWPWNVQVFGPGEKQGGKWRISQGSVKPIVFSPDGTLLVSGTDENRILVHDIANKELIKELTGHRARIDSLAFTPNGRTLVSSSADRTLRLWHVPTWRDLGILDAGRFHGFIGFDQDGERLTVVPAGAPPFAIPSWGDDDVPDRGD